MKTRGPTGNPKLSAMLIFDPKKAYVTITDAFDEHDGNATAAAEALGIDKTTLYRWLRDHPVLAKRLAQSRKGASAED